MDAQHDVLVRPAEPQNLGSAGAYRPPTIADELSVPAFSLLCVSPIAFFLCALAVKSVSAADPARPVDPIAHLDANRICGPNSLYILLKLSDIAVTPEQLACYIPNHPEGMSLLELKRACAEFGLETSVRRCTKDDLRRAHFPAIAHVRFRQRGSANHYLVITRRVNRDRIEVIDGTTGAIHQYFIENMPNIWDGHILLPNDQATRLRTIAGTSLLAASGLSIFGFISYRRRVMRASKPRT